MYLSKMYGSATCQNKGRCHYRKARTMGMTQQLSRDQLARAAAAAGVSADLSMTPKTVSVGSDLNRRPGGRW